MFTGIIQETGSVVAVEARGALLRIVVEAPTLARHLRPGDSIAVSGVCLTAVETFPAGVPTRFAADLAEETVRRTSLSRLEPGTAVNLELPTPAGAPLGGHVVQGHVDGVGRLLRLEPVSPGSDPTDWILQVEVPEAVRPWIVEKGSIAIEGISLTVAAWDGRVVTAAIIPHTYAHTNLRDRRPGDSLNIEADVLLRHAARQGARSAPGEDLTLAFLIANGY
jgi:riboflavin synthase